MSADGPPREALRALVDRGVRWPEWPRGTASRQAAVLVLLGTLDARDPGPPTPGAAPGLDVLLVGRADTLAHHPGQMAFPGGRVDPHDSGPVAAALREAEEETGLDPAGVEVLGTLGELPVAISRHLVTPVVAWWARPSPVRVVDPLESAHVLRCPVPALVDPRNRGTATIEGRGSAGPAFRVPGPSGDLVVWGFTAYVLDRILTELGWSLPWDPGVRVPVPLPQPAPAPPPTPG